MSTQALARVEETPTDLTLASGLGLEGTFIKPTMVELVQRTSRRQDATPGKLYDVLTQTNFDSLHVVPLGVKYGRALFPSGELGVQPICRSDDGIVPSPYAQFPQSSLCKTCDKSSWDNYDRKTKQGKPSCQEKAQMLFIMRDTGLPRRITLGGMSLKPLAALMERLKQDVVMARYKGDKRNIFDYTFTITPLAIQGQRGNYFIANFTEVKQVAEPGEFGPMFVEYVVSAKARRAELEAAKSDAAEEAVGGVVEDTPIEV